MWLHLPRAPGVVMATSVLLGWWSVSCCFHSVSSSAIDVRVVRHMILVQLATDTCHIIPTVEMLYLAMD